MGYVFDFKATQGLSRWLADPRNQPTLDVERRMVASMLSPLPVDTVLGIGCGTGSRLANVIESGIRVATLEPSPYMLDLIKEQFGERVERHRGDIDQLPFDDNSFNHVCLLLALEFARDPSKAISEACRVAKDQLFIGFLNRYAVRGIQHRVTGMFRESFYNRARFFSVWELKRLVRQFAGDVPMAWRTVCHVPTADRRVVRRLVQSSMAQRCPFGSFGGLRATLVPKYRTRPLPLRYTTERRTGTAAS